jgi:hypothetical protein
METDELIRSVILLRYEHAELMAERRRLIDTLHRIIDDARRRLNKPPRDKPKMPDRNDH